MAPVVLVCLSARRPAGQRRAIGVWEQAVIIARINEWIAEQRAQGSRPEQMAKKIFAEQTQNWVAEAYARIANDTAADEDDRDHWWTGAAL
jgi:hypothetical protein